MNEQTHTTEETISNETKEQEVVTNGNAEQTGTEEGGSTSGETINGQVSFEQIYDMISEKDKAIESLKAEITSLKKSNTDLLLKVNASANPADKIKTPYESFIDSMVSR